MSEDKKDDEGAAGIGLIAIAIAAYIFWDDITRWFSNTFYSIKLSIGNFFTWVISMLVYIILISIVVWFIYYIFKYIHKKHKDRESEKKRIDQGKIDRLEVAKIKKEVVRLEEMLQDLKNKNRSFKNEIYKLEDEIRELNSFDDDFGSKYKELLIYIKNVKNIFSLDN